MPIGAGKYDALCTAVRDAAGAQGAVVVVVNGANGSGFSCQLSLEDMRQMIPCLRDVAEEMEKQIKEIDAFETAFKEEIKP